MGVLGSLTLFLRAAANGDTNFLGLFLVQLWGLFGSLEPSLNVRFNGGAHMSELFALITLLRLLVSQQLFLRAGFKAETSLPEISVVDMVPRLESSELFLNAALIGDKYFPGLFLQDTLSRPLGTSELFLSTGFVGDTFKPELLSFDILFVPAKYKY